MVGNQCIYFIQNISVQKKNQSKSCTRKMPIAEWKFVNQILCAVIFKNENTFSEMVRFSCKQFAEHWYSSEKHVFLSC